MRLEDRQDIRVFLPDMGDAVLGWGRKNSGMEAQRRAIEEGRSFILLEDGFLRSIGREDQQSSLVLDWVGIYYDAACASTLEQLIRLPLDERRRQRADDLIHRWRAARVSKYNSERDYQGPLPERFVLVCDQTAGDHSIRYGLGDDGSFRRMLIAALDENPDATIIVKTHPDRYTRRSKGYFSKAALAGIPRVMVIDEPCHPVRLLEHAERVYCVTSQMGFEALLWGKPVRVFGMPFYAGWGLTADELPAPRRRGIASLQQLVHAALVDYSRYVDSETGKLCEVERIIDYFAQQRRMRERFPAEITAVGISRRKRPIVRQYLAGSNVRFARSTRRAGAGSTVAVWGSRSLGGASDPVKVIRIEDGFLRSVGLGADLVKPLSWVCDDIGIYYDATRPSRLEHILQHTTFDTALLDRAAALRQSIIEKKLSKYNIGAPGQGSSWSRPANGKRMILVPGQVEDDASIRLGTVDIRSNITLLRAVRARNPDAHIIYKPHPDVVAGLRRRGASEEQAADCCDEIVTYVDIALLLDAVDEVHTMTSLTGFEALMRGVPVTCYGLPFYAGWGLTIDMHACERRGRRLTLDELVAGALILYPTYISQVTNRYTSPERVIEELVSWRSNGKQKSSPWRAVLRLYDRSRQVLRRFRNSRPAASTAELHD